MNTPRRTLTEALRQGLVRKPKGKRTLPFYCLYDELGMKLTDKMSSMEYGGMEEIELEVLQNSAMDLAAKITNGTTLLEIGAGSLSRTKIMLEALEKSQKSVTYYICDIRPDLLSLKMRELPKYYRVNVQPLVADPLEASHFLAAIHKPKILVWFGSSIGNLSITQAMMFLSKLHNSCNAAFFALNMMTDKQKSEEMLFLDQHGVARQFVVNLLRRLNSEFQANFNLEDFDYWCMQDTETNQHEAYICSKAEQVVLIPSLREPIIFDKDELIRLDFSHQFTEDQLTSIANKSGWQRGKRYRGPNNFSLECWYVTSNVPTQSLPTWERIWNRTDYIFRTLLRDNPTTLLTKPIDCRHSFLFYRLHMSAFLDHHVSEISKEPPINKTFARKWHRLRKSNILLPLQSPAETRPAPNVPTVLQYTDLVRDRLRDILLDGELDPPVLRCLKMCMEYECMLQETLFEVFCQHVKNSVHVQPSLAAAMDLARLGSGELTSIPHAINPPSPPPLPNPIHTRSTSESIPPPPPPPVRTASSTPLPESPTASTTSTTRLSPSRQHAAGDAVDSTSMLVISTEETQQGRGSTEQVDTDKQSQQQQQQQQKEKQQDVVNHIINGSALMRVPPSPMTNRFRSNSTQFVDPEYYSQLSQLVQESAPLAVLAERVYIPAGKVVIGCDTSRNLLSETFNWDVEGPRQEEIVAACHMRAYPVTCGEYAEFVTANGYLDHRFWRTSDWEVIQRRHIVAPSTWVRKTDGSWGVVTATRGVVALKEAWFWPVYVSLMEVRAFCNWRNVRPMTEAEYMRATYGDYKDYPFPWGQEEAAGGKHGNFDWYQLQPMACFKPFSEGTSQFGAYELIGNGWEWTQSVFDRAPEQTSTSSEGPIALEDLLDGKHYVLKGASWATDNRLLRKTYRRVVPENDPFLFAKFRYVISARDEAVFG